MTENTIWIPGKPIPWSRTGGRGAVRYTRPEYRAWLEAGHWHLVANRPRMHDGPVRLSVVVDADHVEATVVESDTTRPKGLQGDLDNYGKAVADLLTDWAYFDDRQIAELDVRWAG